MRFRIDPPDCGCVDCLLGIKSRPLEIPVDEATGSSLVRGYYENASGYKIKAKTYYEATPERSRNE